MYALLGVQYKTHDCPNFEWLVWLSCGDARTEGWRQGTTRGIWEIIRSFESLSNQYFDVIHLRVVAVGMESNKFNGSECVPNWGSHMISANEASLCHFCFVTPMVYHVDLYCGFTNLGFHYKCLSNEMCLLCLLVIWSFFHKRVWCFECFETVNKLAKQLVQLI